jgi:hypothetical protein
LLCIAIAGAKISASVLFSSASFPIRECDEGQEIPAQAMNCSVEESQVWEISVF